MVRTTCESSPASKRELNAFKKSLKRVTVLIDDEELVAVAPERRNWRGIFIALLVIAAVFSLIIFSIFLLSPEEEANRMKGRRITLNDVLGNNLKWKPFSGTWINSKELVFKDTSGGLSILNAETLRIQILMTNSTFRQLNAEFFDMSPDQKYILLSSDSTPEGSRYHVYEIDTQHIFPLSEKENIFEPSNLQHVVWAPASNNGKLNVQNIKIYAQGIAFVHENDLYYKPKVRGALVCRITTNGKMNTVYNGIPDWTYSNIPELNSKTIVFSPDGQYLSYMTFNDTLVNEYKYILMSMDSKYPRVESIRYPKAGTNNPNVTVYVVNLSVLKFIHSRQIILPSGMGNDSYIGAMIWSSNNELSLTVTDRKQTKATTLICRSPTFNCQEIHTEVTISDGWVLPSETPIFSKEFSEDNMVNINYNINNSSIINNFTSSSNNNHYNNNNNNNNHNNNNNGDNINLTKGLFLLKRLPVRDSEFGHYRHIVLISPIDRHGIPLTMGKYEVTKIIGWDEKNDLIYFLAAPENKPGERHLYKINFNGKNINRTVISSEIPKCLTCNNTASTFDSSILIERNESSSSIMASIITFENTCSYDIPNNCLYNDIYFSKDYSYYIQECLGPESPTVYLVDVATNIKIFTVDDGEILREKISELSVPQIRIFNVEIRHGFHAQVKLYLPPGMKEEEEVSFPLVLEIDASPGSQLVSQKYSVDWNWYLCSQRQIIVAQIDARGSGFQGELLRTQVHGKLGTVEIEDQLGVLTYLRDNLKFIDPARICAYGWGYGGFATAMALIDDSQQILQCAVAVNPITSFGYYYSFFTERYIPINDEFSKALQESDLAMKAGNLKGRNFLIIYSTADTLVHQDHSILLSRSLIDQDIKFRQQVYADENHNIEGSINHLYNTIEWYIDECYGPLEESEWDPTGLFEFRQ